MSSRTGGAPANSSVPMAMGGSGYGSGAGTGSGGLSEEEAGREMKKMLAFIMQEADEKVNEIKVKANEEFNIEKAKLVRMESAAIEAQHDRRLKQAEVKRRIAHSAQLNKARLQILQARDQIIDEVNNDVLKRLREQINPATYQRTLENLLVQSLMRLMEEKVDVICRECDVSIVNDLIASARAIYSQKSGGRQCEITVNTSNFLPGDRAGGLKVTARNGKIVCDNTIETRLEIALEESFPTLRLHLFGPNPNRRFFD